MDSGSNADTSCGCSLQQLLGHLPLKLVLVCLLALGPVSCLENSDIPNDYDYDYDDDSAALQKEWEQGEVRMHFSVFWSQSLFPLWVIMHYTDFHSSPVDILTVALKNDAGSNISKWQAP